MKLLPRFLYEPSKSLPIITVPTINAAAINTIARDLSDSIEVVMITDKSAIEKSATIILALRTSALCSSSETITKLSTSNFSVTRSSSRFAQWTRKSEVMTYITQKIMHLYQSPSVTLVPAAMEAIPMVRGLVIAVVNPTPEAISTKEIAVKRDQFSAVQSIAKTG